MNRRRASRRITGHDGDNRVGKANGTVIQDLPDFILTDILVKLSVRQILTADGRLHMTFEIPSTGSSQNYTRSYYMNGRDYIDSGSCDEHVVRVCCAQTGKLLRDISLEGRCSGASMYVQSLRGDPFRDFNMSILAAYMRPSSKYENWRGKGCKKYSINTGKGFPCKRCLCANKHRFPFLSYLVCLQGIYTRNGRNDGSGMFNTRSSQSDKM